MLWKLNPNFRKEESKDILKKSQAILHKSVLYVYQINVSFMDVWFNFFSPIYSFFQPRKGPWIYFSKLFVYKDKEVQFLIKYFKIQFDWSHHLQLRPDFFILSVIQY